MSTSAPTHFEEHLDEAYQRLRASLTAVVLSARGEVTFPQDLARHLHINKNLAWRISKIIENASPEGGIPHLPGASGIRLLLEAARRSGTSEELVTRVEEAHSAFQAMIDTHAGDQQTFELLLDGLGDAESGEPLAASRKLAFLGNSGIVGAQAKSKLTSCFLAPSASDPDKLDTLLVGGFVDVCRLRGHRGWPLFRIRAYRGDGGIEPRQSEVVVLHEQEAQVKRFDAASCHDMLVESDERAITYRLGPGRVGRTGIFSAYFGSPLNGVFERYRSEADSEGEIFSMLEVPCEWLLFDMFIHRSLGYGSGLRLAVYGRPGGGLDDHERPEAREPLPIHARPEKLPGTPDRCVTPICPRYPEILRTVTAGTGWDLREFTCHRYAIGYPPLHSTAVIRFPLDERAGS